MKNAIKALIISASLTFVTSASSAMTIANDDRALIVKEVVEYFKSNPQELVEAIIGWRETSTNTVSEALNQPVSGNRNGDVVIFEFIDFDCKPCVLNAKIIDAVTLKDGDIAVVHYDLPISSKDAAAASLEVIAASQITPAWTKVREHYLNEGVGPEARLKALDVANLRPDQLNLKGAMQTIRQNREAAKTAGVTNPPAIVISVNNVFHPFTGPLTEELLTAEIQRLRSSK